MLSTRNLSGFILLASTALATVLETSTVNASDLNMEELNDIGISAGIKEKRLVDNDALKIAKSLASFPDESSPVYTLVKKRINDNTIKVTASDYSSYKSQDQKDNKYLYKELIVSGNVKELGEDGFGLAYMILGGADGTKGILSRFTADSPTVNFLSTVEKGDAVNLFCHGASAPSNYDARLVYCRPVSSNVKFELKRLGGALLNYNKSPIAIPALYAYYNYNTPIGKYTEAALLMSRARKAQTLGVECSEVSQACADQANKVLATVVQHDSKIISQELFRSVEEMDEEKLEAAMKNI